MAQQDDAARLIASPDRDSWVRDLFFHDGGFFKPQGTRLFIGEATGESMVPVDRLESIGVDYGREPSVTVFTETVGTDSLVYKITMSDEYGRIAAATFASLGVIASRTARSLDNLFAPMLRRSLRPARKSRGWRKHQRRAKAAQRRAAR